MNPEPEVQRHTLKKMISFFKKWTFRKPKSGRAISTHSVQGATKSASNIPPKSEIFESRSGLKSGNRLKTSPQRRRASLDEDKKKDRVDLRHKKPTKYRVLNEPFKRFEDYYKMSSHLGQGMAGFVRKCVDKCSGEIYAVKILLKTSQAACYSIKTEIEAHRRLSNHPFVAAVREVLEDVNVSFFFQSLNLRTL